VEGEPRGKNKRAALAGDKGGKKAGKAEGKDAE
jgi:hypothetical protein